MKEDQGGMQLNEQKYPSPFSLKTFKSEVCGLDRAIYINSISDTSLISECLKCESGRIQQQNKKVATIFDYLRLFSSNK